jgi:predicted acyl esterase
VQEQVATRKQTKPSEPTYKMTLEKDVDIPMRDGARLKADVFRPEGDGHFPVLINMGIYQKDKLWVPPDDLEEKPNPYMNWETVNPEWWVPRGYCCVRVDERGSGKSPGQSVLYSPQEAIDFYDAIEWAGHQPWSNGRVATIGISFFARTQWWVANLKPPSLTCIVPWEGAADQYRDILYHGGIFGSGFIVSWFTTHMAHHMLGRASTAACSRASRHSGTRSICRCGRSATGPEWDCTCVGRPRAICAPHRRTRSCASTAARITIRSTARTEGATSSASSITGSRTSTTA